jgi:hypothetical protein
MTPKSETESQIQLEIIKGRANPIEIRQCNHNTERICNENHKHTEHRQNAAKLAATRRKGTLTLMPFRFLAAHKTHDFCMRPFEDRRFRHL